MDVWGFLVGLIFGAGIMWGITVNSGYFFKFTAKCFLDTWKKDTERIELQLEQRRKIERELVELEL